MYESGMNGVIRMAIRFCKRRQAVLWLFFPRESTWEHYEYPWDVSLCSSHKKTNSFGQIECPWITQLQTSCTIGSWTSTRHKDKTNNFT